MNEPLPRRPRETFERRTEDGGEDPSVLNFFNLLGLENGTDILGAETGEPLGLEN